MTATAARSLLQSQPLLVAVAVGVLFLVPGGALHPRRRDSVSPRRRRADPALRRDGPAGLAPRRSGCALGRLRGAGDLPVIVTMCLTGLVLDGIAIVWFAGLYDLPSSRFRSPPRGLRGVGPLLALARKMPGLE
jgi:hypothetical protein